MAMVVGLKSGKELFVQNKSFFIQDQSGTVKQVLISESGNRRFIVKLDDIEFIDEPNTQEYLDVLDKSIKETTERVQSEKEIINYG